MPDHLAETLRSGGRLLRASSLGTAPAALRVRRGRALWLTLLLCSLMAANAHADAYVPVNAALLWQARPGEGLLTLHSGYRNDRNVDAEAMVWMAGRTGYSASDRITGDVLTINVGLRTDDGWASARVGRLIVGTGAIRPVHIDGARTRLRAPFGGTLEAFFGVPLGVASRSFDWVAGGRVGQAAFGERVLLGVSYVQQRDAGMLQNEEVGGDLSLQPLRNLWLRAVASWDVTQRGFAAVQAQLQWVTELHTLLSFVEQRVPSRLLPSTSLFSTISDSASSEVGLDGDRRLFPRLSLGGRLSLQWIDSEGTLDRGYRATVRSRLTLDEGGSENLLLELSRRGGLSAGYSALYLALEKGVVEDLHLHAACELVAADEVDGAAELYPYTNVGLRYEAGAGVMVAGALLARATPQYRSEVNVLLRVSYQEQNER